MESGVKTEQLEDYARIASAIQFIRERQLQQPSLQEVAAAVHLSEFHLQRLFTRWAGISPKRFLQCLTLEHAKRLLAESADVLSSSHASGLSGPGRLHDLFVQLEAVTPGEYKSGGAGIQIAYGFAPSPFGECLLGVTDRGICYLGFVDDIGREVLLADLSRRWPRALLVEDSETTAALTKSIFAPCAGDVKPVSYTHLTLPTIA